MDLRCLVGAVVIEDEMDVEVGRNIALDGVEEMQKLLGPVPTVHFSDHSSGLAFKRRKQRRRAVANVVVRATLDLPRTHWKQWLAAIQRLDLRLLIRRQDQRAIRRVEVQPDDISHFLDEQRIFRDLEGFAAMRFQRERTPHPTDRALAQSRPGRQGSCAPVRCIVRHRFQRQGDHALDLLVVNRPRRARTWFIEQAVEALGDVPRSPFANGLPRQPQARRDMRVRFTIGARENDARTRSQRIRTRLSTHPPLEDLAIRVRHSQGDERAASWHANSREEIAIYHRSIHITMNF